MKRISLIINIVLAVAVCALAYVAFCGNGKSQNDTVSTILTRTSIRAYTSQPVEQEKVETLLRAAMAAPTAMNKQPWDFVVVNDAKVLAALSDSLPYAKMLKQAQLAIVVCGNKHKTIEGNGEDFWIQDASAATENLLLAAHAMGLGAVWTGVYPTERVAPVSTVLGMPDYVVPLNVIPVGYPAESPEPKDKWKPENIHYNAW